MGIATLLATSGCAIGVPRPVTYLSDRAATVNANLYSTVEGETGYQVRYGKTTEYGSQSAPGAVGIANDAAHPVSIPLAGLEPSTTYHWQLCVEDQEESPPRRICGADKTFTTSPPGGRGGIAFSSNRDGNSEIFVMNADGTAPTRLTTNAASDTEPSWSPDGRRIVFSSDRDGNRELYAMNADGSGVARLTYTSVPEIEPAWSPAGDRIMFSSGGADHGSIVAMDLAGGGEQVIAQENESFKFFAPAWAPDGVGHAYAIFYGEALGFQAQDAGGGGLSHAWCNRSDWHPSGRRLAFGCADRGSAPAVNVGDTTEDRSGTGADPVGPGDAPAWSPDGSAIAFVLDGDIWTMNADGSGAMNRTNTAAAESAPDWSPRP